MENESCSSSLPDYSQAPRRDSRYCEGATPMRRLKVRVKWLWSQMPHVISDRALVGLVKRLGQMHRMHADVMSQLRQRKALGEARVQKVSGLLEPPRRQIGAYSRIIGVMARSFSDHFEHQPFDHERGDPVYQREFFIESSDQQFVSAPMKFGWIVHHGRAFARALQPVGGDFDNEGSPARIVEVFRMRFVRRVEEQRRLAAFAGLSAVCFGVIPLHDVAE